MERSNETTRERVGRLIWLGGLFPAIAAAAVYGGPEYLLPNLFCALTAWGLLTPLVYAAVASRRPALAAVRPGRKTGVPSLCRTVR